MHSSLALLTAATGLFASASAATISTSASASSSGASASSTKASSSAAASSSSAAACPGTNAKYLYNFGDSYSATGFYIKGTQPACGNPGGNLNQDKLVSDDRVWPQMVASNYNHSFVYHYDFAWPGSTISTDIVPATSTFEIQLTTLFNNKYVAQAAAKKDVSYYTVFFGINDIFQSFYNKTNPGYRPDYNVTIPQLVTKYISLTDQLHGYGARKFVFLNVPDFTLSPAFSGKLSKDVPTIRNLITTYNSKLGAALSTWASQNTDSKTQVFDTYSWFNQIFPNYAAKGFTDNTSAGTTATKSMWWTNSSLHWTTPMHNYLAQDVAAKLDLLGYSS